MKNKDKILSAINDYVYACGGDPDTVPKQERDEIDQKISNLLSTPETIQEAVTQIESYLLSQSQAQMKTGLLSGAEGNMLFKLSQIKKFLNLPDKP